MEQPVTLIDVDGGLFQPANGLWFAPIRHHSPACAWAVRAMIQDVRPKHVAIEAPADFVHLVPLLVDPTTRPPIAMVGLHRREVDQAGANRLVGSWPLCAHSPEYAAILAAQEVGAEIRFIDLPSVQLCEPGAEQASEPISLMRDSGFSASDYNVALAKSAGCRDVDELWDYLFEARLGDADWRALLADVGTYCAALRAATTAQMISQTGDRVREEAMALALHEALDAGGPVVVVTGGFHTPALIDALAQPPKGKRAKVPACDAYLIRYSFAALDRLNGYGAGLPQPGWYDHIWNRANNAGGGAIWTDTALDLTLGFSDATRAMGYPISLPQQMEMVRVAEALARMRGRPGAMRYDLFDGAKAALVKDQLGIGEPWQARLGDFLRGNAIGDVPRSAGSPPIVEDARKRARLARLDISDGVTRHRKLDIRRNGGHLAASQYLHAMALLEAGFANREAGPDYLNDVNMELLFEEWSYTWSPLVEGRLIELAAYADTVNGACLASLAQKREELIADGQSNDLAGIAGLIGRGVLAGLGGELMPLVVALQDAIIKDGSFSGIAACLITLHRLTQSRGPMRASKTLDLTYATQLAYQRLIYLFDDLPSTPIEDLPSRIEALRLVANLLASDVTGSKNQKLDHRLFDDAVDRLCDGHPPPTLLGAVLGLCVQAGRKETSDLAAALSGSFKSVTLSPEDQVGVLGGFLCTAPHLLWRAPQVLDAIDHFLVTIEEDRFITLLPSLRLALTTLNPRDVDKVAVILAARYGIGQGQFQQSPARVSSTDFAHGQIIDAQVRVSANDDGLTDWLFPLSPVMVASAMEVAP